MEEEKNWKKAEIKNKIDYNNVVIKQKIFFFALLIAYGIATPVVSKLANLNPAEVAFYEKFVIAGTAVISPIFTIKLLRKIRENEKLKKLLKMDDNEIEEEQEEDKEMTL